jgi:Fic family protein
MMISKKQAIKCKDKLKTSDKIQPWLDSLEKGRTYRTSEIALVLDISQARARVYLKELAESGKLKSTGANKGKVYYLPE